MYQRDTKQLLMAHGNKQLDRNVFAYLVDLIDLNTGLIGRPFKVSNSRIACDISEKGGQGTKQVPIVFTTDHVRNAIKRLCDYGVFERLSMKGQGGNLLLRACIRSTNANPSHSFNQNEVTDKLPASYQSQVSENKGDNTSSTTPSYGEVTISIPSFLPTTSESADTSQSTAVTSSTEVTGKNRNQTGDQDMTTLMSMSLDWEPTAEFKNMINEMKPSKSTVLNLQAAMMDFKLYWSGQNLQLNQSAWQAKLFRNDLKGLLTGESLPVRTQKPKTAAAKPPPTMTPKVPDKLYGALLQQWGVRNGFRKVNPGESDDRYRQQLRNHVNRNNAQTERDHIGAN